MTRGPFFNIIALILPAAGAVYAWLVIEEKSSGGNMGAAIGGVLARYFAFAAACLLSLLSAAVALVRGERPGWLTAVALVLGVAGLIGPPLWLFLSKPR